MKYLRILACDLDGTLTDGDTIAPETWESLRQAKRAGIAILLATGRRLETFDAKGIFAELCEAIVAEDGAVVYFPRHNRTVLPFGRLHPALLQRLAALSIPLAYGQALVATDVPHDGPILEVLRQIGGGAVVEYNRGAVMVLPPGATKGTGLQFALQELGYSPHNVVACGDAENDHSLFTVAEVGVAVANADPKIQALADLVTPYTLLLSGTETQLPPVADVISLAEYGYTSLVLDLSMYEASGRVHYVTELIHAFKEVRERRGIPHWLLLDEAHSLCPSGSSELNTLCQGLMQSGGVAMVSYRPSQVQPELLALLDQWILTGSRSPEEMKVLERYLPGLHEQIPKPHGLSILPRGQACLACVDSTSTPKPAEINLFRTGSRTAPHIRHLNKYLHAPLPTPMRFYFCDQTGRFTGHMAASLGEFSQIIGDVPAASIDYHLYRGDFERWLRDVLHDEELANQLLRLAHRGLHGEELKDEVNAVVNNRYEILASLS